MLSSSTNIRTYLAGLISQSRNLLMHSNQAYIFYVACLCSTLILSTLSLVVGLPCVFEAYQVLSLIWISIPIVSCSLLFSPSKRLAMQVIMEKNIVHLSSIDRFTW
uniref:Uncharacterized protein n=1 Tax=Spongospora subterranea TaxID=70186 RepID=A0A0H5QU62_9EUKA|eukprot:CRZ05272.1 hypothetical protein [Spongospora subterranea]